MKKFRVIVLCVRKNLISLFFLLFSICLVLFSSANNSPSAKRKNDKFKDLFAQIVEDLK